MSARVTEADRRAAEALWWSDGPWRMGSVGKLSQALADYREQATAELVEFQSGVDAWMDACFGEPIKSDHLERADRLTEEALELVQTVPGFTADRAHALVDYVFGRPVGERGQEVGGTMVCLAALCNTFGISIKEEAERELARIWTKVEQIRAKQAAKPTGSALPIATEPTDAELVDDICRASAEALKPLPFESSDAPESAGARATEPSERGE